MQIKHILLLSFITFLSFPAFMASGQCLTDAEYTVSFENNKGIISVEFDQIHTGIAVEIVDLVNKKKGVIHSKKWLTVRKNEKYELFGGLKESLYALSVTADDCDDPKFDIQVIKVGLRNDE